MLVAGAVQGASNRDGATVTVDQLVHVETFVGGDGGDPNGAEREPYALKTSKPRKSELLMKIDLATSERKPYVHAYRRTNGARAMKTKVVGYIRVSTEKQADTGISLAAQRSKIEAYALAMDLDLVAIVEDPGASAKTLERPGLRSALAMLQNGKAEALLVVKLDRLTRSVRDLGELVERYFATRYSLLSMSDAIDTRTAAGRLVLNVLTSVAQWEREATGERTREAMKHKASKGEFCGGSAPYGYAVDGDGKLVPNEAEQAVLRVVAELKQAGLSLRGIAAELDRAGIASRNGKAFAATQIARMVAA